MQDSGRHPGTRQVTQHFSYDHLPEGTPRYVSEQFHKFADRLLDMLGDGPEFTVGLRKLLEAKDCCVRQAIIDGRACDG